MSRIREFLIYGLVDPRTDAIRYVGKSTFGIERAKHHGMPCNLRKEKGSSHKANWIKQLQTIGLSYRIIILERMDSPVGLYEAEQKWIAIGKSAGTLTNLADGGPGNFGCKFSDEIKQKMSKCRLGIKFSSTHRENLSRAAKNRSPEHVLKIANSLRGRTLPTSVREKIARAGIGRACSEETRRKRSVSVKAAKAKRTEEQKERTRALRKLIKYSDATREKMSKSAKLRVARKFEKIDNQIASIKIGLDPILRWAGSKRWALPHLLELYAPHHHRRLVEPFVGSMSVALGLQPERALLADVNHSLVALHNRLRDPRPFELIEVVTDAQYKALRDRFNNTTEYTDRAELFYALNRTCFNGLSRFNRNGDFNVPWGKRTNIVLQREFPEHAAAIKNWEIIVADFSVVLARLQPDDFLYIDPPYHGTFSDYAEGGFKWDEQERLAVEAAAHTGPVVASNSSTDRILELYQDLGFDIKLLDAPRRISSNGDRASAKEMLATKNMNLDSKGNVGLIISSTVQNENTGELEMANLPKGWGQQVANADATIQRQDLKPGDYTLDHICMFGKDTKAGPAIIIEHKIVTSKAIKEGVEPMAPGTKWGFFLPGYGAAKVMQLPNMKSYFIGMFGIDEAKMLQAMVASGMTMEQAKAKFAHDLGEVIDSWGDGAGRGYRVRGVTFETQTKADEPFTGMNWYPLLSENTPDQITKRAAELGADAIAAQSAANGTPSIPAGPSAFAPPPAVPGAPAAPDVPSVPAAPDPLAAALAAGWKEHPQNPAFLYLDKDVKAKADFR